MLRYNKNTYLNIVIIALKGKAEGQ